MKQPFKTLFAASLFLASHLGLKTGLAQNHSDKELAKAVSIMGCLIRGDEPKEVWLAEKSGRIYGLESSKIDLNVHLGHKVIVKGYILPEGKEESRDDQQMQNKTGNRETSDFRVVTLKMVSSTCMR